VDCAQFSPQPEPRGVPVVLFAGRMLWEKGLAEFIAAIRILRKENVSARFVLVGEPDLAHTSSISASQLRAWVAAGLVEWWGNRDDMPKVFAQSNLVCLPSYGEGVPKSLIEAAACGRALVACDVPGCREIVHHGENGFLVPVRDAGSLAHSIATLVAKPSLRAQMGARGRAIAVDEFSEQLVLSQTLAVYHQLLRESCSDRLPLLESESQVIKQAQP
jgi:glycosyltransferase involved in cell wall biosynthesis